MVNTQNTPTNTIRLYCMWRIFSIRTKTEGYVDLTQAGRVVQTAEIKNNNSNNTNSRLDATITNFIDNYNQLNMFRAIIYPLLRSTRLCLQLVVQCTDDAACWWQGLGGTPHPCHQQSASSVHYTTSCKHSLVLLGMGEIIVRNMLSWL